MQLINCLINLFGKPQLHNLDIKHFELKTILIHRSLLLEHEDVDVQRVHVIRNLIRSYGYVKYPILADVRTLTILDGHHRFRALLSMGLDYIPVFLVDYAKDYIEVSSWRKEFRVTKVEVILRAISNSKYPPRTSRHILSGITIPSTTVNIEELVNKPNPKYIVVERLQLNKPKNLNANVEYLK